VTDSKDPVVPSLPKLGALKDKLEAERAEIFPRWKAALDEAKGNITRAAVAFGFEPTNDNAEKGNGKSNGVREQGAWLTIRLGLVEYAAGLRKQAGRSTRGRPPGSDGKSRKRTIR
jgi:hypothetical protein